MVDGYLLFEEVCYLRLLANIAGRPWNKYIRIL